MSDPFIFVQLYELPFRTRPTCSLAQQISFWTVPLHIIMASGHVTLDQRVGSFLDHDGEVVGRVCEGRCPHLRPVVSCFCCPATEQQGCEEQ